MLCVTCYVYVYYYIYDSFLNEPKYRKILERIEVRLADFGIQGKIRRLNILHHQKEAIEESIRRGATTIVLVGDDRGIAQAIDTLAHHDVALGIIPLGDDHRNRIARALGIPPKELACEVLSRRTIARLDLGKIGTHYFLTTAEVQATTFTCIGPKRSFRIQPITKKARLVVTNLAPAPREGEPRIKSNPRDGIFELVIADATRSLADIFRRTSSQQKSASVFPLAEIIINEPEGATVHLDGCRVTKIPVTITIAAQKLRVIVGRERLFR